MELKVQGESPFWGQSNERDVASVFVSLTCRDEEPDISVLNNAWFVTGVDNTCMSGLSDFERMSVLEAAEKCVSSDKEMSKSDDLQVLVCFGSNWAHAAVMRSGEYHHHEQGSEKVVQEMIRAAMEFQGQSLPEHKADDARLEKVAYDIAREKLRGNTLLSRRSAEIVDEVVDKCSSGVEVVETGDVDSSGFVVIRDCVDALLQAHAGGRFVGMTVKAEDFDMVDGQTFGVGVVGNVVQHQYSLASARGEGQSTVCLIVDKREGTFAVVRCAGHEIYRMADIAAIRAWAWDSLYPHEHKRLATEAKRFAMSR